MRLARHDLDTARHVGLCRNGFDIRTQGGNGRNYKFNSRPRTLHMRCSQKEPHSQVAHFRLAAARQDGDNVVTLFQPELLACGGPVRVQRNHAGQRVADIGGGNTVFCQQGGLEREDTQHMVGRAADFLDPVGTPGPDGWADKMHGRNALGLECSLQPQVEVGCVHPHKHVGALTQQAFTQLFANAE